ncbi:prohibitin family protein, partial [Magnetococcales bacterium HHB-1]
PIVFIHGKENMFERFTYWFKDKLPYMVVITLVLIMILIMLWSRIFIVIRPGEAGVIYRPFTTGTVTNYVYPEGLHIINPFNHMAVYNTRLQVLLHSFEALTNHGLPIRMDIAIRFSPIYELVGLLHQNVGPDYPQKIIIPQVESVIRQKVGDYSPEDIYTNKKNILSNIITLAIEEVGQLYINVDEIIIRSLELPAEIKEAIERKLVYEQRYHSYKFRIALEKKEAERKRIEALGRMVHQDIISLTLTDKFIKHMSVQATEKLSQSDNAKVVIIGSGKEGLPVILGNQ